MTKLPPRRRLAPIHRWAGVALQFERTEGGWLFRRAGCGPAIRVTVAERDAFANAGMRALLLHVAAFTLCAGAAWLLVHRLVNGHASAAIIFGVVASLIAAALYRSQRWYADAPARALAQRPIAAPARDPDFTGRQSYGAIAMTTVFLLFLAGIGTRQPPAFYVVFATCSVMLGLFLAVRKWRADARLTPSQLRQAEAVGRQEERWAKERGALAKARADADPRSGWLILVLLGFVVLELIVLIGAILVAVAIVAGVTGVPSADLSFGPFMVAFVGGLALGGLLCWPLDRLCKRWTGASAAGVFDWLPAGW